MAGGGIRCAPKRRFFSASAVSSYPRTCQALPAGPATLALRSGRPLYAARALRLGPDRFTAAAWPVEAERTGDRRADAVALTRALAARFERMIGEAPEQWFAAFQPFWPDRRP